MEKQNNFSKQNCSCGFSKTDSHVQHICEYSGFGQVLYWIGISAIPVRVNFVCSVCKEVIESTDEQQILKKYVGR
jgi:hypothetical protein